MGYLNCSPEELTANGGFHTAREISNQPVVWGETYSRFLGEKDRLIRFIEKFRKEDNACVIFTGAGTSAFIGEILEGPFQKKWKMPCRAVGTTDIVTHPENYFIRSKPTLLVSFARSGDSPESLYTVQLAREYCDKLYELNITCNPEGELARNTAGPNAYLFLLPEETNDRSLAMTSSFSSMLLTGLLLMNTNEADRMEPAVTRICKLGKYILDNHLTALKNLAETDFNRVVFLGSGPLYGTAHESHLKVQEMSNGRIIGKYDTFMGFRHGPKAVVNDSTLVVYFLSNDPYVAQYEEDLVRSVIALKTGEKSLAVGNSCRDDDFRFDLSVRFPGDITGIPEEFLALPYILPAQIIGFYKSLSLKLSPDNPSVNASISRVVQGVKIHARTGG
jgi:tagatose-6-phosphate ketose/aldose isomerase